VKSAVYSGLLVLALMRSGAADEMQPPRTTFAQVDWSAAMATVSDIDALQPAAVALRRSTQGAARPASRALTRLNRIMTQRFAGIATSPVPVLLPFDTEALLREQAAGIASSDDDRYLSGFHAAKFFYPGPAGYDAAFVIRTSEVPELAAFKFKDPIEVQISGSVLLYELDGSITTNGVPVPALEAEFPGIRRLMIEHHLRYTFVRFGVPYVVSITCFDSSVPRYRMPTCRAAEQVALRFLGALRMVGGTPQNPHLARALPIERPARQSETFTYYGPGQLLSGTDYRGRGGRADRTVYSQIRFPLAEAPAYANSQTFQSRNRSSDPNVSPNYSYPWRDNFCERRGFPVGQCPAGIGHQGQDIRPHRCVPLPGTDRCTPNDELVAARGGVILRSPKQEAAYLFVNSAVEHIRFRYLHMNPSQMDQDELLSGRLVHEGEVIGHVGNFSSRAAGTSYHLHFDIQVPTKDGWVFVNPYMTLVAAYERLIGERGKELDDTVKVSAAGVATTGSAPNLSSQPPTTEGPTPAKAAAEPAKPPAQAAVTTKLASTVDIIRSERGVSHPIKLRKYVRHRASRHSSHRASRHRVSRHPSHRASRHARHHPNRHVRQARR
jgi:hypothetical protein